ncbi:DUF3221 domain-containing protein [Bacillus toyonensis]|uniref:DUF3221 domain-containing protein n=1 Tax=Bacillus toyonensis TaxID=155322 RepID=UPI000BEFA3FD|nr:DUF3221 domain-containing protein [Bacillus toyonensis]PEK05802.1 DUF3221 domain-containing protein [Bacillus toyonensis]PGA57672.1 DUF3221 domain-containing protein [Bacillus toyonensis]PGB91342.1 DUF3221 domain-containing protein [Bacillus toyonensis]HDR7367076.1 DUF3221 domain-containing protein [Bacillus toyonensis]
MIKKCAVIGALGIAIGGVCLSEIENSKLKGTNTGMQQKDNFSQVKPFDLTGYVVGIHKSSNLIEVANVETKEEAIEFTEKRYNFINLAVEDKFVLFENKDNQEYKIGEQIKLSAEKIERINHLIKILIEPTVIKLTTEK